MRDATWETEYTTEPVEVSRRIKMAPTMAGGLALLVDGEHVDHFYEDEMERMEKQVSVALDVLEQEGHATASQRKFNRYINECVELQTEITHLLYEIKQKSNSNNYSNINAREVIEAIGQLQNKADMLMAMKDQLSNKDLE